MQTENISLLQLEHLLQVLWVSCKILLLSVACMVLAMEVRALYKDMYGTSSLFDVFTESWLDSMLFSHTALMLGAYAFVSAYFGLCTKAALLSMGVALSCNSSPWNNVFYYFGLCMLAHASMRCTRRQSVDCITAAMHLAGCYIMSNSFMSGSVISLLSLATHAVVQHAAYAQIHEALEFLFASDTRAADMYASGRPHSATLQLMPFINHSRPLNEQRTQMLEMRNALRRAARRVLSRDGMH